MAASSSRDRAVETAAILFQEQGYAATGVAAVIEASGTPKGSFYFNFPGGKEELGVHALELAGARLARGIGLLARAAGTPREFVASLTAALALGLKTSDYSRGCPVATVALETAGSSEALREAAAGQLRSWQEAIAGGIAGGETPGAEDRRRAERILMLIEGALIMCRVQQSIEPLRGLDETFALMTGS
jgi:TetR/AcrR family transcriptional repressor of lmrAB and yxaGH operons